MASFNDILTRIDEAVERFNKRIPAAQKDMLDGIEEELRRLDLKDGRIKPTVANLKVIASIKNKLLKLILTEDYLSEVKEFAQAFKDVSSLQNEFWKSVEAKFKPSSILKEIQSQAIGDTVNKLTEQGIGLNVTSTIEDVLRANITSGGPYKDFIKQFRELIVGTNETEGIVAQRAKQVTTDAIHQYNANYTQIISSDLGYEWFAYQGSDIKTTRPFCDAMSDRRYFHVSEIPDLLAAEDLYYTKDSQTLKVQIYPKTGLPAGMIPGTNPENFFIRRGGYNCGHQIRPVSERLVIAQDKALYDKVISSSKYKAWKSANG